MNVVAGAADNCHVVQAICFFIDTDWLHLGKALEACLIAVMCPDLLYLTIVNVESVAIFEVLAILTLAAKYSDSLAVQYRTNSICSFQR